jgi:hypothetical protein
MFDWLFEGRLTVYLALAVAALVLLGLWTRDRKRGWLLGVGVVGAFVLAYFLLDRFVETGREQVGRKLQEMAAAVKARSADRIFAHISDRFTFQGMNKAAFRGYVEGVMSRGWVTDLTIWDVDAPDSTSGQVRFRAKPRGSLQGIEAPWVVRARFVQESGGEWRLESFTISSPLDAPVDIPQLPR